MDFKRTLAAAAAALTGAALVMSACGGDGEENECPGNLVRDARGICVNPDNTNPDAGNGDTTGTTCDPVSVVINEVLYDPDGADATDDEFIELAGDVGGSLDGYSIAAINGANGETYVTIDLSGSIGASGLFLIGGANTGSVDVALTRQLQNGPDAIQLLDCDGEVVDAVAYGGFEPRAETYAEGLPTDASGGESIARCAGVEDSDDNATDFGAAQPTPGAPNMGFVDSGFCDEPVACEPAVVVINEVFANSAGQDDAAAEFVELAGPTGANLADYTIEGINGSNGEVYISASLSGVIGDDGLFVVGGESVAGVDAALGGVLQNGPDAVVLRDCNGAVIDAFAYGNFDDGVETAGEGEPGPMGDGVAAARCVGEPDTGDNSFDFGEASPTPGEPNDGFVDSTFCGGGAECTPGERGAVRISEVLYDPEGSDGGKEFIELTGPAGMSVTGLTIVGVNGSNGDDYLGPIALDGSLDAQGFFVLGGESVSAADQTLSGTVQNGPDSIVLYDCDGSQLDALAYGVFGEGEVQAGEGEAAAASGSASSLARCLDSEDSDDNASDFSAAAPTPGAANLGFDDTEFCGGAECGVGVGDILVNEVGAGAAVSFVELLAMSDVDLTDISVEINGSAVTLPGSATTGMFVAVPLPADIDPTGGSVRVLGCAGVVVVDAVAFGTGDNPEGSAAPAITSGQSLARCPGGVDSDDNESDFAVAVTTSPGAANDPDDFEDPSFCEGGSGCDEAAHAGALINEVLYNPEGGDDGKEFVEVRGPAGASLAGATLVGVNGSTGDDYFSIELSGAIGSDGLFVVGGASVAGVDQTESFTIQNGPDSVVLYGCAGTRLDAVGYDSFGSGDTFAGEGVPADSSGDGSSLSRCVGAADSGDNNADFGAATPSPGAANSGFTDTDFCGGGPDCTPGGFTGVTINEVLYNPDGGDTGNEWLELHGPASLSVDGLHVVGVNGANLDEYFDVTLRTSLDASGFLVLGGPGVPERDVDFADSLQNGPDNIVLRDCDGTVIDALAYGSFDSDEFPVGEGTPADEPPSGQSMVRIPDGQDTGDNATDFQDCSTPTPGESNSCD